MKSKPITIEGLKGTTIVRENERIVLIKLSIPVYEAHTIESYLTRLMYVEALLAGSGKLTRHKFLDTLSLLGSSIATSTDGEFVHVSLTTLDSSLGKSLELLKNMLTKPLFDTNEISRIKKYLTNLLILAKEDARGRAHDEFLALLTPENDTRHPFPIDSMIKVIKKISGQNLVRFHQKVLESEWIFTTGSSEDSLAVITSSLANFRKKKVVISKQNVLPTKTISKKGRVVTLLNIPNKENIEFSIGNSLPLTREDEEFVAFYFGMSVLSLHGGFAGRLMSIVREKEGLTYTIYGGPEKITKNTTGFWRIFTFFNPKSAVQGISSTLREIERMQKEGITEDELARFKSILNTRLTLIEDSLIKKLAETHLLGIQGITENEYRDFKSKVQLLTKEKVNDVLKKYLNSDALIISGAGPIESVKKELQAFSKSK